MFERCVYFQLNKLHRSIVKKWDRGFAELDLSSAHAYVILSVLDKPDIDQKSLAEKLDLADSTISRFIDSLVKKGWLEKKRSTSDGRNLLVKPSQLAITHKSRLKEINEQLVKAMKREIGRDTLNIFVGDIKRLNKTLKR